LNLQPSAVGAGCFRIGTVMHEFIHAIGFYHMHSATELDEYVEIVFDKIQEGTQNNFVKYDSNVISNYGVEYDYGSVMHYPTVAFSIDGSPTIIPTRDLNGQVMGQRLGLSDKDFTRLNNAYCQDLPVATTTQHPIVVRVNGFINNLLNNIFGGIRM
jgi:Astacin (Peptidase family M12A)